MEKSNWLVIFCCASFVVLCVSNSSATPVTIDYNSFEWQVITGSTVTDHWYSPSYKPYGHEYRECWSLNPTITWATTPASITYDNAMYDLSFSFQNGYRIETFVYQQNRVYYWQSNLFDGYHYYVRTDYYEGDCLLQEFSRTPHLSLIPEPATILLFGLGGLALRRRIK